MPKITTKRIHRLHISLFEDEYLRLKQIADRTHVSISYLLRHQIYEILKKEEQIDRTLVEHKLQSDLDQIWAISIREAAKYV